MLRRDSNIQLNPLYRFQWESAQQAHVLLYPEGMIRLGDSAAEILKRCLQPRTVADIIAELETQFPDAPDLAADVLEFLTDAYEQHWIQSA